MDAFSLGQLLREAREAKELTLQQAEQTLRIRRVILEAFEAGNFDQVDASSVQIRGLIRNYARYVGQDEDRILQYYDSVLDGAHRNGRQASRRSKARERALERETKRRERYTEAESRTNQNVVASRPNTEAARPATLSDRRRPHALVRLARTLLVLISGVAAVALIAFVTVQLLQRPTATGEEEQPASLGVGVVGDLPPTLTLTPRATATSVTEPTLLSAAVQNYAGEPVFVTMEFRQRVWLRVMVDGVEQFAGLVRPQEAVLEYRAANEIVVNASSAGALVVTYNGQPQPAFGARGQGIDIIFRPNDNVEVITGPGFEPTPLFSPTPQDTPIPVASTLLAEQTASPTPDEAIAGTNTLEGFSTLPPAQTPVPAVQTPIQSPAPTALPVPGESPTPSSPAPEPTQPPTVTLTEAGDDGTATPGDTGVLPPRMTPTNAVPPK